MKYENDFILLVLLKSKEALSRREKRQVEGIEISYPGWNQKFEGTRNYLCSKGYVDKIDVSPHLPIKDEFGGGIVYKDGEKFEYITNKKGLKALRENVFPSTISRRREDDRDRKITRAIAVLSIIIAVISILTR